MKEIVIPIEFANPVDFYGVNDANLQVLRTKFPGAKIVSRGSELKILGSDKQVRILTDKTEKMIA
ncbi:MAG: phosphate starvation-inducible protein PhoH, partial [Bacteroidia bacterium]|nr:phosphate starvation-inducible protein PhoH [Bacteroidia bacterium]